MGDGQSQNTENENTSTQTGGEEQTVSMTQSNIGVDDVDVLKSIVTTHKDNEQASKTELEQLTGLLEEERNKSLGLEQKLTETATEAEIQNIAIKHGINPDKMKYFKMDYLDASQGEGFDIEKFIGVLKEKQPDFFGFVDERRTNVPNPQSRTTPSTQISMEKYVQLSAGDRAKYKSDDIIR